jgi:hypothetical protein
MKVRRVGVAMVIGKFVVASVNGAPNEGRTFDREGAGGHPHGADQRISVECSMREESVETDRHAEAGHSPTAEKEGEVEPAHETPLPHQGDADDEAQDRKTDGAGHHDLVDEGVGGSVEGVFVFIADPTRIGAGSVAIRSVDHAGGRRLAGGFDNRGHREGFH